MRKEYTVTMKVGLNGQFTDRYAVDLRRYCDIETADGILAALRDEEEMDDEIEDAITELAVQVARLTISVEPREPRWKPGDPVGQQ